MNDFFQRLRERKLVQWSLAYVAATFALIEVIDVVAQRFGWPEQIERLLIVAMAVGFFVTLVLAWYHGEKGAQRVTNIELVVLTLVLAAGGVAIWHFDREVPTSAATASPGVQDASTSPASDKSIAVLPFENLSDDKANAYFADGMQDEILTRLSKIGTLRVISRTSTLQFASHPENLTEIAKKLGVATILEGSVQKSGNKVRINVQLIRAQGDQHLWAETYDRTLDDVFGVQGEVAGTIADKLGATLSGDARKEVAQITTRNPVALDAYLRGMALSRQGFTDTIAIAATQAFAEAVTADPDFAQAWAAIVRIDSRLISRGIDGTPERRASALRALETAERLQPDALDTLAARASYTFRVQQDNAVAYKLVADLHARWPNDTYTAILLSGVFEALGRDDEGEMVLDQALQLDPLNPRLYKSQAILQTNERHFVAALATLDRALALTPGDEELRQLQGDVYLAQGDLDRAAKVLDKPPETISDQVHQYVLLARMQRRYAPAIAWLQRLLATPGANASPLDVIQARIELADLQVLNGDRPAATDNYRQVLAEVEPRLLREPDNDWLLGQMTSAKAALGDEKAAMAGIERLSAMRPESKDARQGRVVREGLARVLTRIGHKDEAIAELRYLLGVPYGGLLAPITAASLRLDPAFDSLRDDPRFLALTQHQGTSD